MERRSPRARSSITIMEAFFGASGVNKKLQKLEFREVEHTFSPCLALNLDVNIQMCGEPTAQQKRLPYEA